MFCLIDSDNQALPRLSSSLRTTISPNRFKVKRRVTFLEDYTDAPTTTTSSSDAVSMENARHVVEDKCTVRDAASTGSSSGRPGVFPQGPALSRQTRPALTLIRTRQSPSSSGRAAVTPQPAPARTTTLTGLAHFQKEMEASISRLLQLTTGELAWRANKAAAIQYNTDDDWYDLTLDVGEFTHLHSCVCLHLFT